MGDEVRGFCGFVVCDGCVCVCVCCALLLSPVVRAADPL